MSAKSNRDGQIIAIGAVTDETEKKNERTSGVLRPVL
jgi:hypothetical protein